jgi:hypothetical protein
MSLKSGGRFFDGDMRKRMKLERSDSIGMRSSQPAAEYAGAGMFVVAADAARDGNGAGFAASNSRVISSRGAGLANR